MSDRLAAARAMRRAGHCASAIAALCGISLIEAAAVCNGIHLGWTEEGFFKTARAARAVQPPVEKPRAAPPLAISIRAAGHVPARASTASPAHKRRPTDLNFKRPPPPVAKTDRASDLAAIEAAVAAGRISRHAPGSPDPLPLRAARALKDRGYEIENSGHGEFRINGVRHSTASLLKLAGREAPELACSEAAGEGARP